jgi:hypothetical protein
MSLPRLAFPNYTKITKYEASEKNAVSETEMPHLGNLKYSRNSRKAPVYWEFFGLFTRGDLGALVLVAERVGFERGVRSKVPDVSSVCSDFRFPPPSAGCPSQMRWPSLSRGDSVAIPKD